MTTISCIETVADLKEGSRFLSSVEPRFKYALDLCGPLPLRLREEGFKALLDMIVSQQLSVAAADTIWSRLENAGLTDPEKLVQASDGQFRECGLSRQKQRYARALAVADIDYPALGQLPDKDIIKRLTAVTGIGRWTAEIYAMSALGRPDVFAAGDLALQESSRMLFVLDCRPTEKELRDRSRAWSPWRSVAARLLWSYYRAVKKREGIR